MTRTSLPALPVPVALLALACAADPETFEESNELGKTHSVVTVERAAAAASDTEGSASAVARFVTVPAFTNPKRMLGAAGLALDLPTPDTCRSSDAQFEVDPAAGAEPIELVEAGDVTLLASNTVTPLVPHAFPTVGNFASGVLYATRDRASAGLPAAEQYVLTATGSDTVPALRVAADAPSTPAGVEVAGVALKDVTEVRTSQGVLLAWTPGEATDTVYAELLAYDGSPSIVCTFHDDAGTGLVPEGAFAGTGAGRIALHRVRARAFETSEMRFDFQVGVPVEFAK